MPKFHVRRSTTINAAPEKVFATVADFRTWSTWSPWLCAEPDAELTVSEDSSSVGSTYAWKGEIVGEGVIEHRRLEPGRLIEEEIRFVKPFPSTSQVKFELKPVGKATGITWHMNGSLPWFLFWMRSNMEAFIGMDYERGLRMLKEWIETGQILSKTTTRGVEPFAAVRMAGIRKTCPVSEIGPSMESAFAEANETLQRHNLPVDGPSVSVYHNLDVKRQTFDYTSGYVLPDSAGPVPEGLTACSIPAGKALCVEHVGSYEHLGNAWSAAHQYVRYKKLKLSKVGGLGFCENDPKETPPAELRTRIVLPLK
jgi:effector-binding domain-containing protein